MCATWVVDVFFFKQKTAYEMRISDWSSDVCSSDLRQVLDVRRQLVAHPGLHGVDAAAGLFDGMVPGAIEVIDVVARAAGHRHGDAAVSPHREIGRASCRERVCQYV